MRRRLPGLLSIALAALLAAGCAHTRYDLAGDPALVPAATYQARRKNPGAVEVIVKADYRPDQERSNSNLGDQFVTDSAWREPFEVGFPRAVSRELVRAGIFAHAAGSSEVANPQYRLEIAVHRYEGVWHGGVWNFLVPWTDMRVTSRIDLEFFLWSPTDDGKMNNLLFHRRYSRDTSSITPPFEDGHRKAAEELGRATTLVLGSLLADLDQAMPGFGYPPSR